MITVLMATRNGAQTLPRMLERCCRLQHAPAGWRLVAIDNASTDETPAILRGYADRLPVTILEQPRPGKNRSLNTGLDYLARQPDGNELIVFTDDDTLPEADWLQAWQRCAAAHPDHDVFAGRITPAWDTYPPAWLTRLVPLAVTYAVNHARQREGPTPSSLVWGPNMAVRRTLFDAGHRFDEDVGPGPGNYRMGSETEFTGRMQRLGHGCWHCVAPSVGHIILPAQMDVAWLLNRAYRIGRGAAGQAASGAWVPFRQAREQLFCAPGQPMAESIQKQCEAALCRQCGDFDGWLRASMRVEFLRGYFAERRHGAE
ncbi:MAG: glycosyltransferase, partial [Gammaproteobacteria bacterium]|nr:glycosyltransferase [Gammaproteobacteria bacterium]